MIGEGLLRCLDIINGYTYVPESLWAVIAVMIVKACILLGSIVPCQLLYGRKSASCFEEATK